MLVPMIIPVQISLGIMFLLGSVFTYFSLKKGRSFSNTITIVLFTCFILSIPLISGVKWIIDPFRYREFQFNSMSEITDPNIKLPKSAKSIIYFKEAYGHHARFQVSQKDLAEWINDEWDEYYRITHQAPPDEEDKNSDQHPELPADTSQDEFDHYVTNRNWKFAPDMKKYKGPHAADGAGFQVWYSEKEGSAFLEARYW